MSVCVSFSPPAPPPLNLFYLVENFSSSHVFFTHDNNCKQIFISNHELSQTIFSPSPTEKDEWASGWADKEDSLRKYVFLNIILESTHKDRISENVNQFAFIDFSSPVQF